MEEKVTQGSVNDKIGVYKLKLSMRESFTEKVISEQDLKVMRKEVKQSITG